mgnify:CR=1 FL=1
MGAAVARIPDEIKEASNALNRDLNRLSRQRRGEVLDVISQSTERLNRELEGLDPDSFRAQQARISLLLGQAAGADLQAGLEEYLFEVARESGQLGGVHSIAELNNWLDYYGGEVRIPNVGALASYTDEILIERFAPSLERYGEEMARQIGTELASAQFERISQGRLTERIQGVIERERWQAERIVRTETSHAYNASHHGTLRYAKNSGMAPDLQKTCIVTYDARTDEDSYPLDGQVRDLDENFVDGDGRSYLHPPGRPNDREKEIPYVPELTEIKPESDAAVSDLARAEADAMAEDAQRNIAQQRMEQSR